MAALAVFGGFSLLMCSVMFSFIVRRGVVRWGVDTRRVSTSRSPVGVSAPILRVVRAVRRAEAAKVAEEAKTRYVSSPYLTCSMNWMVLLLIKKTNVMVLTPTRLIGEK